MEGTFSAWLKKKKSPQILQLTSYFMVHAWCFLTKTANMIRMFVPPLLLNSILKVVVSAIKQKISKRHPHMEKVKLSLSTDTIVDVEKPIESTK